MRPRAPAWVTGLLGKDPMVMKKKLITAIFVAFVGCMTLAGCSDATDLPGDAVDFAEDVVVGGCDIVRDKLAGDSDNDNGNKRNREHSIDATSADSDAHGSVTTNG